MRKSTKEEFIQKAIAKHGNFYDYSKVVYINSHTPVEIICPKHGKFYQMPYRHLQSKYGCEKCGVDSKKTLIRGVAYNDTCYSHKDRAFKTWIEMLKRCYPKSEKEKRIFRSYEGCVVCQDWLLFSNFKKWFDRNYVNGYVLDKDLLWNGEYKIYSPDTCCFIPQSINNLLQTEHKNMQRNLHRFYKNSGNCYQVHLRVCRKDYFIGTFSNEEKAIKAYLAVKKNFIKDEAAKYYSKGLINDKIYNSLLNFKLHYANH